MPTRYSRAGRLSSMPLRLCSQLKLVSHPRGATAMRSRSSFAFAGGSAVCAKATATPKPRLNTTPPTDPLCTNRFMVTPPLCLLHALDKAVWEVRCWGTRLMDADGCALYDSWHLAHAMVGQALGFAPKRPVPAYFTHCCSCFHALLSHV